MFEFLRFLKAKAILTVNFSVESTGAWSGGRGGPHATSVRIVTCSSTEMGFFQEFGNYILNLFELDYTKYTNQYQLWCFLVKEILKTHGRQGFKIK